MKTKLTATQRLEAASIVRGIATQSGNGRTLCRNQYKANYIPIEIIQSHSKRWAFAKAAVIAYEGGATGQDAFNKGIEAAEAKPSWFGDKAALRMKWLGMLQNKKHGYSSGLPIHLLYGFRAEESASEAIVHSYTVIGKTSVVEREREAVKLSRQRRQALCIKYRDVSVKNKECFTVELEFVCQSGSLLSDCNYNFGLVSNENVEFVSDGSVIPNSGQVCARRQEARVSLAWGKASQLYETCRELSNAGAEVNRSCGMHIHLDSRHLGRMGERTRRMRLVAALPWLLELVPASRRGNTFCMPNGTQARGCNQRYQAINPTSFRKHGTTEIRLGAGTIDPDKILNWATLLRYVADSRKRMKTFESFLKSDAPQHIKVWAVLRRDKFFPASGNASEGSET